MEKKQARRIRVGSAAEKPRLTLIVFAFRADGSLSDTAVSQQQWNEASGRKMAESRSPKSEMLTRERDPLGSGMGRKSNSTSQLSATGLFIYSSHYLCFISSSFPFMFLAFLSN